HGELRARFADGLRGDNAGGLAQFHHASGSEVAAVTHDADTTLGFAGKHGADLHPLDTAGLDGIGQLFGDLVVDINDDAAFVVLDLLQRDAADDAVAQRLNDLARLHDGADVDAIECAAISLADDDVLGHVHQAAGEVAGVGGLKRRIRQPLSGAVRGDEVLQYRQSFAEVGGDGRLDDLARRLGHQAAHAAQLADLLFRAASARIGHDVNGIEVPGLVLVFHGVEHLIGHLLCDLGPDLDHLVVALVVGDGAIQILLLHADDVFFRLADQRSLVLGNDHVVNSDGKTGAGGRAEAQLLDIVEHAHRGLQAKAQVAIVHHLTNAFFLQQAV